MTTYFYLSDIYLGTPKNMHSQNILLVDNNTISKKILDIRLGFRNFTNLILGKVRCRIFIKRN